MRELRVQSGGRPIRIFYAFDPRRAAILLIGGIKSNQRRFYDQMVPMADRLFDQHLDELKEDIKKELTHGRTTSIRGTSRQMSPKARNRAGAKSRRLRRTMDLAELRRALELSQQQLAKRLRVNQPEVAKIEKRADMLLSTLGAVLRAMGADLKIVASFPQHDVQIRSLGKVLRNREAENESRT